MPVLGSLGSRSPFLSSWPGVVNWWCRDPTDPTKQSCLITWKITGYLINWKHGSVCLYVSGQGSREETAQRLAKCIKAGEAQRKQGFCCPSSRSDWIAAKHTAAPAYTHHLLDRFGAGCEWLGREPCLLYCSHDSCPHLVGELLWILDAAWAFCILSVQNECLQQHCKLVNRYPLPKRKGHCHFPLPSLSGMISHLSKQGAPAFSGFQ